MSYTALNDDGDGGGDEPRLGPEAMRHVQSVSGRSAASSAYVPDDYDPELDAEPEWEEPLPQAKRGFKLGTGRTAVFVLLVAAAAAVIAVAVAHSATHKHVDKDAFFVLTDVHLDIEYAGNCSKATMCREAAPGAAACDAPPGGGSREMGQIGCDSPLALVRGALQAMQEADSEPSFIVLTGDFIAHDHEADFGKSIGAVESVASEVRERFPSTRVLPALGNNDGVEHWCGTTTDAWLGNLTEGAFKPWLVEDGQVETFLRGGYYVARPEDGLRVTVLNTVFYAQHFVSHCVPDGAQPEADPYGQLAWFRAQVQDAAAAGDRVIVAGHVPPVVNPYAADGSDGSEQWVEQYVNAYLAIVSAEAETVDVQLFAHLHRDGVRVSYSKMGKSGFEGGGAPGDAYAATLLNPSVSPIYNNNPAFRRVEFKTKSGAYDSLHDYDQYFVDVAGIPAGAEWKVEYSFRDAYMHADGQVADDDPHSLDRPLDVHALAEVVNRLYADASLFSQYMARSQVQWHDRRDYELCALSNPLQADYVECHASRE